MSVVIWIYERNRLDDVNNSYVASRRIIARSLFQGVQDSSCKKEVSIKEATHKVGVHAPV
jgi:hypothetical protein